MKKILITGVTGFIGRNILEYFSNTSNRKEYSFYTPTRNELNLLDEREVSSYLTHHKFDVIIHCAVSNDKEKMLDQSLRMFLNFEKNSNKYGRMLYLGSGAEYDKRYPIKMAKEYEIGNSIPVDSYGMAKYTIHKLIEKSMNIYNLRLFGVFGKYEKWAFKFISNICCKAIKNLPLSIRQNVYFDYLYIDDFCKILEWFIENEPKHQDYNVVNGQPIDLITLGEIVRTISDNKPPIYVCKEGYDNEYTADNSRLLNEIGNFEFTPHEEAIKQLYQWYQEHEDEIILYDLLYKN